MIWDLITGLGCAFIAFAVIMLLCMAIGKIAEFLSPYKGIK